MITVGEKGARKWSKMPCRDRMPILATVHRGVSSPPTFRMCARRPVCLPSHVPCLSCPVLCPGLGENLAFLAFVGLNINFAGMAKRSFLMIRHLLHFNARVCLIISFAAKWVWRSFGAENLVNLLKLHVVIFAREKIRENKFPIRCWVIRRMEWSGQGAKHRFQTQAWWAFCWLPGSGETITCPIGTGISYRYWCGAVIRWLGLTSYRAHLILYDAGPGSCMPDFAIFCTSGPDVMWIRRNRRVDVQNNFWKSQRNSS